MPQAATTKPRRYGRPERAQSRGNEVLRMHILEGMTFREIGKAMNIDHSRAWQIYKGALNRAQRHLDGESDVGMQRTLGILQVAITEAYEVVTRTCPKCYGHGTRGGNVCRRCTGTGFWYDPDERRRWLDRLMRANEQRSRLLGEHQPEFRDEDGALLTVRDIVTRMDPDDIARQARLYLQGREDERAAQAAQPVTAAVTEPTPEG